MGFQTQLTQSTKTIRVINATAAGTSTINGSIIDTQGFDAVRFVVAFGAITATSVTSIKVQEGAAANMSDAADLAGTNVGPLAAGGADDNKVLIVDIYRPLKRHVRVVVVRTTANAAIDSGIAELYIAAIEPVATDTSVSALEYWQSPAEGVA